MLSQVPNPSVAALYEDALVYETGSAITSSGALTAYSGKKTGRSPLDKRIVKEPSSENEIWWGPVNKPMTTEVRETFTANYLHVYILSLPRIPCSQDLNASALSTLTSCCRRITIMREGDVSAFLGCQFRPDITALLPRLLVLTAVGVTDNRSSPRQQFPKISPPSRALSQFITLYYHYHTNT